jgi:hypothetical protein
MGSLRADAIVREGWVPWSLLPSSSSSSSVAGSLSPSSSSLFSSYDGGEAPRFRFFVLCPSEEEVEAESDESDSDSEESV